MTKRQSTTAKITKAVARLIERYTESTGNGVIIRHRGVEIGATAENLDTLPPASECTIRKTTIATLERWKQRTSEVERLVLVDHEDGTVGNPIGRFIVSNPDGLVFSDGALPTPNIGRFVDDTLDAETVGVWRDAGKVYIDANTSFDTIGTALAYGRAANQLAIWDCKRGVAIEC